MSTAPVSATEVTSTDDDSKPASARISMLGRAAKLLNSFGPQEWVLSLAELTRKSGLPKPTAHRIAVELTELGLLEHAGTGYRLGIRLVELGHRTWWQCGLREVSSPYLEYLREATGYTANLGVLDGTDVVCLAKFQGTGAVMRASRTGSRLPSHCTGLGKAILALSSPAAVRAVVERGLRKHGPRTIVLPKHFARELVLIRERGTALDVDESGQGVLCAAAPLTNGSCVVGAISVSGCSTAVELDRMRPVLASVSHQLSNHLTNSFDALGGVS